MIRFTARGHWSGSFNANLYLGPSRPGAFAEHDKAAVADTTALGLTTVSGGFPRRLRSTRERFRSQSPLPSREIFSVRRFT